MKNYWINKPPSNLHDGNLNDIAHSNEEVDGMWVRLYLEERAQVTKIIVYNRKACCRDRLVGASVFIKSGDEYVTNCGGIKSVQAFIIE